MQSLNAAGSKTRADYLIKYIGGENIFSDSFEKYKKVNKEDIIKANPDIIFIASIGKSENSSSTLFKNNKEFKTINAVKNGTIYNIGLGKHLSFGPNFVKEALELINKINIKNNESIE
tara:strand:+ start:21 stop:374 length:354 start_codon:yes stop_codon:yes gene_type:complete